MGFGVVGLPVDEESHAGEETVKIRRLVPEEEGAGVVVGRGVVVREALRGSGVVWGANDCSTCTVRKGVRRQGTGVPRS